MFGLKKATFNALVNVLMFEGTWLLSVLGAAAGNGWLGTLGLCLFFLVHHLTSTTAAADFRLAAIAVVFGGLFETALIQAGLISYSASLPLNGFAPLWLLTLWAAFALTMNGCLAWLHGRYWLAALLGGLSAPVSYWGGAALGAATTDHLYTVLAIIGLCYAIATPALLWAARHFATRTRAASA